MGNEEGTQSEHDGLAVVGDRDEVLMGEHDGSCVREARDERRRLVRGVLGVLWILSLVEKHLPMMYSTYL